MRAAPAILVLQIVQRNAHEHTVKQAIRDAFPARWVTACPALPGVTGFLARHLRSCPANLTPARALGPHDFAVRIRQRFVSHVPRHRIHRALSGSRDRPLIRVET